MTSWCYGVDVIDFASLLDKLGDRILSHSLISVDLGVVLMLCGGGGCDFGEEVESKRMFRIGVVQDCVLRG